jgi:hypothetical protein
VAVQSHHFWPTGLSFVLHSSSSVDLGHIYIRKHLYNINPMPSKPVEPITIPVRITFPDNTELWTTIDPTTQHHSVCCDLCNKIVKAGLRGSGNPITAHRGTRDCLDRVFKKDQQAARERLQVSNILHD